MSLASRPSMITDRPWVRSYCWSTKPATIYSGKWLLFVPPDRTDDLWQLIMSETECGTLGPESKCATGPTHSTAHSKAKLICTYTKDCRDLADVKRVLWALRNLGFVSRLYYKENSATRSRIYGNGAASLYASPKDEIITQLRDIIEPIEDQMQRSYRHPKRDLCEWQFPLSPIGYFPRNISSVTHWVPVDMSKHKTMTVEEKRALLERLHTPKDAMQFPSIDEISTPIITI